MSILKFVTETPKSLEEMYRYITDSNKYICMQIGTVLGEDKFQVIGAIHFDKQPYDLHCHYIVHNTSIFGDTRGHGSNIFKLREKINSILLQNGLHTIPTFKDK